MGVLAQVVVLASPRLDPGLLTGLDTGACGVKLYIGHRSSRRRPLDDALHAQTFAALEQRGVPVLLHVNTFRHEPELDALLAAYPKLELLVLRASTLLRAAILAGR